MKEFDWEIAREYTQFDWNVAPGICPALFQTRNMFDVRPADLKVERVESLM